MDSIAKATSRIPARLLASLQDADDEMLITGGFADPTPG